MTYFRNDERLPIVEDTLLEDALLGLRQGDLRLESHQLRTQVGLDILKQRFCLKQHKGLTVDIHPLLTRHFCFKNLRVLLK